MSNFWRKQEREGCQSNDRKTGGKQKQKLRLIKSQGNILSLISLSTDLEIENGKVVDDEGLGT